MRILLLCHRFPYPPNRGGRIRPFHMLEHLGRTHELTVATLVRSPSEADDEADLRARCARLIVARVSEGGSRARAALRLLGREPLSMGYFHAPRLAAALRGELSRRHYDLICVHSSSVAPYVASVAGIPKLLDFGDMDSQKWLAYAANRRFPSSLVYALEGRRLQRAEMDLSQRFDVCACATRDELETLRNFGTAARSDWFSNGVDTDHFRPTERPRDADTICFLGQMSYYPNWECMVRFCAEILPRLRQRRPKLELLIVGADPPRVVRRLARRPGVTVTGCVDDVRVHAGRAALSIAPLRIARGTQNKVLESMAMGMPVVCSPIVARGVDAIPGEHLLTADTPAEWEAAILRVLDSPGEQARLAHAGRGRMLSHHSWANSMRKLDGLIEECLELGRRT